MAYKEARALEHSDARRALAGYRKAAKLGYGCAALQIAEIYERGRPGVQRDLGRALQWHQAAREFSDEKGVRCP